MSKRLLYPVFFAMRGKFVVVVGGGKVAERKVRGLVDCSADVRVVAPAATDKLREYAQDHSIELIEREFDPADIRGAFLVIAATDDRATNTRVCQQCDLYDIPVNRVETPQASDFVLPAVLRRGDLTVAVSTGGASPAFARVLRDRLAREIGEEYAQYIELFEKARERVMRDVPDPAARRRILQAIAEDRELMETYARDDDSGAWRLLNSIIDENREAE